MDKKRRSLVLGLSTAPLLLGTALDAAQAGGLPASPPPPPGLGDAGIDDMRGWAAQMTARMPVDAAARQAFSKRKALTALTHAANGKAAAEAAARQVRDRVGAQDVDLSDRPDPGGVGYGVFFNADYKAAWGTGTSILFDVVCPEQPGGNVNTYLYLTATNRAALGVEAFVLYWGQYYSRFMVFDWAQTPDRYWQVDIPLAALEAYLFPDASSRNAQRTLSVWNSTYSIGQGSYRNEALLYNHLRHGWDLFYRHDYAAADWQQKTGWIGSWGPIIETFQSVYSNTNPMGARRTLLTESGADGAWNRWSLLKPAESYVRSDNQGFDLRYVAPNFAFIATS